MPENKKNSPSTEPVRGNAAAAVCAFAVLAAFAAVLIIPQSREVFKSLSSAHPYIMGFIKFGLLATVGEVLALRLRKSMGSARLYRLARHHLGAYRCCDNVHDENLFFRRCRPC